MPLPALAFQVRNQLLEASDDSSDEGGVDGILSMLRSDGEKTSHPAGLSEKTPNSAMTSGSKTSTAPNAKTPNSDNRRVKFDPAFDKPSRGSFGSANLSAGTSKPQRVDISATEREHVFKSSWKDDIAGQTPKQQYKPLQTIIKDYPIKSDVDSKKNVAGSSLKDGQQMQGEKSITPLSERECEAPSYTEMMHRIASSQQSMQEICSGIKDLQTTIDSRDDDTSKSVQQLIQGVAKSHEQLVNLMDELKSSNLDEREKLIELQLCAENERKVLNEQIQNDKMKLADRWDSIERDRKLLDEQRKELEMQKNAIFIEKEKLLREEALFEQRKLASAEQLKYAEDRIQTANHMDAKLQSEMDRLIELCDFVTKKDAEANDKLANASDLYEKAQELEASLMSDAEVIEHQKQQLERDRNLLVQERVSVLKEKSINRDMCMSANSKVYTNDACYPVGVRGRSGSLATDPDIVLRKRLASIKSQLSKLRD